jgi:penicillin-binding protein 1A
MKLRLLFLSAALLLVCVAGLAAGALPPTDAWTVELGLTDDIRMHLGVARWARFATSRWGIRLLDGRAFQTRWGLLRVSAADGNRALDLRCSPCVVRSPAIDGRAALRLDVALRLARLEDQLSGRLAVNGLASDFWGTLTDNGFQGEFALNDVPVRDLYGLFAPAIPELGFAHIHGTVTAYGRFSLPEGTLEIFPEVHGFEVRGLGTERLAWGAFHYRCSSASGVARVCRSGEGVTDWVPLQKMGRWLPRAVMAAEDARFFDHPGYDLIEIVAALQLDLEGQHFHRGGSTLGQQLARSLFLTPDKTLARKLREILYTVEMEQTLGKKRLLALYLNTIEWGPGIHGARQAAQTYFGKEPQDLRPEEAAWLAAILRNPWKAWGTQFTTGTPDAERVAWVIGRMKSLKRVEKQRALGRCLRFAAVRPAPSPIAGTQAKDPGRGATSDLAVIQARSEQD